MRGRSIICGGLVWGLLIAIWPVAAGAEERLTLDMEAGWQGEYKGAFVPIQVNVTNRGANVTADVTVEPSEKARSNSDIAVAPIPKRTVELPAGATRSFTLVAPANLARPDTKILLRSGQKVLASTPFIGRPIGNNTTSTGVLTDQAQAVAEWDQLLGRGAQNKNMRIYPLNIAAFPEQWIEWSGLDLIIVHAFNKVKFTPKQINVLQQWIANGGTLLVNDGGSLTSSKELDRLLPVTVGTEVAKVQAKSELARFGPMVEQPVTVKQSTLKPDGLLIAQNGSLPLLAKKEVGNGQVVYAGMNLLAPELRQWTAETFLWVREWGVRDGNQRLNDIKNVGTDHLWEMKEALKHFPQLQPIRISHFVVWFAIYLLFVGPLALYFLRKRGRMEWAWLVLPTAGLAMTGAVYLYGIHIRGDAVLVHNLGFVTTDRTGYAHVKGISALLSQERNDYEVEADGMIWPETSETYSVQEKEKTELSSGAVNRIRFENVSQWSMRAWNFDHVVSLGGDLSGYAIYKEGVWEGEVTNRTRYPLKRVAVMIGTSSQQVGALQPHESKRFRVQAQERVVPSFNGEPSWGYQESTREHRMLNGYANHPSGWMETLDVIGWLEEPLMKAEIRGHRTSEASLYLVDGSMSLEPDEQGVWKIPSGILSGRIIWSSEPVFEEWNGKIHGMDNNAEVELEFALPKEMGKIETLHVREAAETQVYDWQANEWKPLTDLKPALYPRFVSPAQRLRLKLIVPAHQLVDQPNLELRGRVKR